MLSLLALAMTVGSGHNPASCSGVTTTDVNACLAARFGDADADLHRYYDVAIRRVRQDNGDTVADGLERAQRSWLAYRQAECGVMFEKYRDGTIRTSMEITCRLRLTRLRTYVIWRDWLTYPDSTAPLLPRPAIDPVLSDDRGLAG